MFASSFVANDVATSFRAATISHKRSASVAATAKMSRIGKLAVPVPDNVKVTINGNTVSVKVRAPIRMLVHPFEPHFTFLRQLCACFAFLVVNLLRTPRDEQAALVRGPCSHLLLVHTGSKRRTFTYITSTGNYFSGWQCH